MADNKYKKNKAKNSGRAVNVRSKRFDSQNVSKEKVKDGVFTYSGRISVSLLAERLGLGVGDIIKYLFLEGKMVNINTVLDDELIGQVCLNFGYDFVKEEEIEISEFENIEIIDDEASLLPRPPVVTIMGHVDHGKTTLLDYLRKSKIAEKEFGGITQATGAYQLEYQGKKITFLDTPGHAAFAEMRARGANITDIVILVVAADDGVMPQTREAIDHALHANVPIIVAINKIDKPGVDPEAVKLKLADLDLLPEEWGGKTIYRNISAKFGQGTEELLDTILLLAEMNELKANPNRYAIGRVIEAELDKGKGAVATLLIQNGSLKVGDPVVVGAVYGRVRSMHDDMGRAIKQASPSTPVRISGLSDIPSAGDSFMAVNDEKLAREIAEKRQQKKIDFERETSVATTIDDLFSGNNAQGLKIVNILIKSDSQGAAEALKGALEKLNVEDVRINIIRYQAGAITESDVLLASAGKAIIIGYNVRPDNKVRAKAEQENVDIRLYQVIYNVVEDIEQEVKGLLKPIMKEVVLGTAEVKKLYKVAKIGTIAGSMVTSGMIKNGADVRLIRNGIVIYTGTIISLKRYASDIKEVKVGSDCGILLENYNDIHEDDIIEAYTIEEVKR